MTITDVCHVIKPVQNVILLVYLIVDHVTQDTGKILTYKAVIHVIQPVLNVIVLRYLIVKHVTTIFT